MPQHLKIRAATAADTTALLSLAAEADGPPLSGPALVAVAHGVPVAAMALTTGKAILHPYAPLGTVPRMRLRRYQLLRQGGHAGPAWALLA
jgi:hypothetical protein